MVMNRSCSRSDPETGLKAIIAIHNTARGRALGGCRMWAYASEEEAVRDALRLSRGMTYKNALADLPFGGGKSVIIGDARSQKTPDLMAAMGRAVDRLAGVATSSPRMSELRSRTWRSSGASPGMSPACRKAAAATRPPPRHAASSWAFGPPSITVCAATAWTGCGSSFRGWAMSAGICAGNWRTKVCGCRSAIFGVRHVERAVESFSATPVDADFVFDVEADVFAPCALGAVINDNTLPRLKVAVVAGSANNQLAENRHGAASG